MSNGPKTIKLSKNNHAKIMRSSRSPGVSKYNKTILGSFRAKNMTKGAKSPSIFIKKRKKNGLDSSKNLKSKLQYKYFTPNIESSLKYSQLSRLGLTGSGMRKKGRIINF